MRLFALSLPSTLPEATFELLLQQLTEDARTRVRNFRHAADAIRSLAGRLLPIWYLRTTGIVAPDVPLEFERTARGKPYLASPRVDFNISHDGEYVLLAVGEHVGVDIMCLPSDHEELLEAISYQLTDSERFAIAHSRAKAELIAAVWTIKEAFVKATGDGISFGLERIDTQLDGSVVGVRVDGEDVVRQGWAWAAGNLGDYRWAAVWRGKMRAGVEVEMVAWDELVGWFEGRP